MIDVGFMPEPQPTMAPAKRRDAEGRRRSGPGRPEGISKVRDQILDGAAVEFADRGYMGTSLRHVADRAHVTQALINYYFGSKQGLFAEVFLRSGQKMAAERMELLSALRRREDPLPVRDVMEAFLRPALRMRETPRGRVFMRLNARLHTEPPDVSYKLRNDVYDESTRVFAELLGRALPHLSAKDVYWRVTLVVGAYLYAFSDNHRLSILAPGICDPEDHDEVLEAITAFTSGGMLAGR